MVSARIASDPQVGIFTFFFFFAMKRCPIAAKIAGSNGILPRCDLNDFFKTGGMNVCPMCEASLSHHTVHLLRKFGLVPITACTCITYFTGCPPPPKKKKDYPQRFFKKHVTAPILKLTYMYGQKPETFFCLPKPSQEMSLLKKWFIRTKVCSTT